MNWHKLIKTAKSEGIIIYNAIASTNMEKIKLVNIITQNTHTITFSLNVDTNIFLPNITNKLGTRNFWPYLVQEVQENTIALNHLHILNYQNVYVQLRLVDDYSYNAYVGYSNNYYRSKNIYINDDNMTNIPNNFTIINDITTLENFMANYLISLNMLRSKITNHNNYDIMFAIVNIEQVHARLFVGQVAKHYRNYRLNKSSCIKMLSNIIIHIYNITDNYLLDNSKIQLNSDKKYTVVQTKARQIATYLYAKFKHCISSNLTAIKFTKLSKLYSLNYQHNEITLNMLLANTLNDNIKLLDRIVGPATFSTYYINHKVILLFGDVHINNNITAMSSVYVNVVTLFDYLFGQFESDFLLENGKFDKKHTICVQSKKVSYWKDYISKHKNNQTIMQLHNQYSIHNNKLHVHNIDYRNFNNANYDFDCATSYKNARTLWLEKEHNNTIRKKLWRKIFLALLDGNIIMAAKYYKKLYANSKYESEFTVDKLQNSVLTKLIEQFTVAALLPEIKVELLKHFDCLLQNKHVESNVAIAFMDSYALATLYKIIYQSSNKLIVLYAGKEHVDYYNYNLSLISTKPLFIANSDATLTCVHLSNNAKQLLSNKLENIYNSTNT